LEYLYLVATRGPQQVAAVCIGTRCFVYMGACWLRHYFLLRIFSIRLFSIICLRIVTNKIPTSNLSFFLISCFFLI